MNAPLDPIVALPPQEISIDALMEKYAKGNETSIEDVQDRVGKALAKAEAPEKVNEYADRFIKALRAGFVPGGRINSAAGTEIKATLINCFVQPLCDSIRESIQGVPSIYQAVSDAAETMRMGGGVGYDFSPIRPSDAWVSGTHSRASGPVSFMHVFDKSCGTVQSAGERRGAQMGILRCEHPDIDKFIVAKQTGALTNFNISVAVTDRLMEAVERGEDFELVHQARPMQHVIDAGAYQREDGKWVYRKVNAKDLYDRIIQSTYDMAEPGIIFIDQINKANNLWYCETIAATNPCAEQPLPPYGCCDLGSLNLTRFVRKWFTADAYFDFEAFKATIPDCVRMLDNVLDVTHWPLVEQKNEAMNKRRIGLGFLGLGSALIMLGLRYDSDEGRAFAQKMSEELRNAAYRASIELAKEKGSFPLFDAKKYLESGFAKGLPEDIRRDIKKYGIRNSHLLSIAPTGTISLAFADNASNGIEPAFSWSYMRKKRMANDDHQEYEVADHAWRIYRAMGHDVSDSAALPSQFVSALKMSAMDHLKMMQVVQPYIDTAISKTVNVPADYPFEDFKDLYMQAWKAGLKGLATYRPNSILGAVLTEKKDEAQTESAAIEPDDDLLGMKCDSRPMGRLHGVTDKIEMHTYEGKKSVYLTVNYQTVTGMLGGKEVSIERPVEFFMPAGQRDEGHQWITANMRLLSQVARSGGSVAKALIALRETIWDKGQVTCGYKTMDNGVTRPIYHDSEVAAIAFAFQEILRDAGFLDADGNQVPVNVLADRYSRRATGKAAPVQQAPEQKLDAGLLPTTGGRKCGECGANAVHKLDGCERCGACGAIGSCG